ncbi:hypothetical protein V9T40_000259 [Parthenolecanium corni]|uniref:WDR36/Utp21 N-terminal domain-containing protein n=1 Tax=Parthenolecanium corni TaxID=536013 RepID=A0AAN9T9H8_9HEMI
MYSLLYSLKEAHADAIWCCAWGEIRVDDGEDDERVNIGDEENGHDENDRGKLCDCIVTGSVDDSIKVWIFQNNKLELRTTFTGHSLGILSVALNSDCSICASSSLDSVLVLWDMKSGTKIKSIMVGPTELWTIAFSPDDNFIISGSHSGKINLFNVETAKLEQTFDTRGKFTLSIAYSPDGKYIASGALDGIINVFDVQNAKLTNTLEGHAMPIRSLCFSPDSKYLLTASDDGHMKVYDVQHATVVSTVSGHASWVLSVAFSPDSKYFVSASSDNTVKVWELLPTELQVSCLHTFKEHADQVWCVKYNKSGTNIVSVSDDKSINIYSCPPSNS